MSHHWIKFWPQDWQRDPALRSCSAAARGVWMDILCIMHEGTPYGHLTIGGKPASARQIGTITGVGEKDALKLLAELDDAGVFSRNNEGVIFSRRMVRDKAASEAGKAFGKEGGNPALKPTTLKVVNGGGNEGGLTPTHNRGPNLQDARSRKLEARSEESILVSPPTLKRAKARSSIPADWQPDQAGWEFASARDITLSVTVPKFRDYHIAKGSLMADWAAAWRTWCSNDVQFRRTPARAPSQPQADAWDWVNRLEQPPAIYDMETIQ